MPLMVPPLISLPIADNNLTTSPGTGDGTSVTPGTANTKTAWSQMIASTTYPSYGFWIQVLNGATTALQFSYLVDIGIGAAGSEVVLLPNFIATPSIIVGQTAGSVIHFIPLFIPKGTRVAMRAQCNATGTAINAIIFTNPNPIPRLYMGAVAHGVNTGTSAPTAITEGTGSTFSSWTSIGSTTTREFKAIQCFVGQAADTTHQTTGCQVEFGYSSTALGRYFYAKTNDETVHSIFPGQPAYASIPTGTQLQARCRAGTSDSIGFMIMGYY